MDGDWVCRCGSIWPWGYVCCRFCGTKRPDVERIDYAGRVLSLEMTLHEIIRRCAGDTFIERTPQAIAKVAEEGLNERRHRDRTTVRGDPPQ